MFTATDYDKLRQIMEESPEKKELLQKLLDSHKMTLSTLSHEIRNPLTLVYSTLQIIEASHPEVSTYPHWFSLKEDVEYIKQLLEELSSYNNVECLSHTSFHSSTFLRSIALSFATSLVDTDIEFTSRLDSALPVVTGDKIKLREVLLNLLRNAKEALVGRTRSGGYIPSIFFEAHTRSDMLCITVKDNGCGISPEHIDTIFDPFVTHKESGTGLGLSLSKRIAAAHNGALTVESIPDVHTTFVLSLPIEQNAENEA